MIIRTCTWDWIDPKSSSRGSRAAGQDASRDRRRITSRDRHRVPPARTPRAIAARLLPSINFQVWTPHHRLWPPYMSCSRGVFKCQMYQNRQNRLHILSHYFCVISWVHELLKWCTCSSLQLHYTVDLCINCTKHIPLVVVQTCNYHLLSINYTCGYGFHCVYGAVMTLHCCRLRLLHMSHKWIGIPYR